MKRRNGAWVVEIFGQNDAVETRCQLSQDAADVFVFRGGEDQDSPRAFAGCRAIRKARIECATERRGRLPIVSRIDNDCRIATHHFDAHRPADVAHASDYGVDTAM